jgi:hypothetical protein
MFFSLPFKREAQKRSSQYSPELLSTSAAQTDFDRSVAQRSRTLSCACRSSSLKLRIWDRCSSLRFNINKEICNFDAVHQFLKLLNHKNLFEVKYTNKLILVLYEVIYSLTTSI